MSRAKWKGPYINPNDLKNLEKKQYIYIVNRNTKIIPKFIGLTFKIHNGKTYLTLTPTNQMIGHKFGEFVFTRANFSFKKKSKK